MLKEYKRIQSSHDLPSKATVLSKIFGELSLQHQANSVNRKHNWDLFFNMVESLSPPIHLSVIDIFLKLSDDLSFFPIEKLRNSNFFPNILQTAAQITYAYPLSSELSQYIYVLSIFIKFDPKTFGTNDVIQLIFHILEIQNSMAQLHSLNILCYLSQKQETAQLLISQFNVLSRIPQLINNQTKKYTNVLKLRMLSYLSCFCNDLDTISVIISIATFFLKEGTPAGQIESIKALHNIICKMPYPMPFYIPPCETQVKVDLTDEARFTLSKHIIFVLSKNGFFENIVSFFRNAPDDAIIPIIRIFSILFSNGCSEYLDIVNLTNFLQNTIKRTMDQTKKYSLSFAAQLLIDLYSINQNLFLNLLQTLMQNLSNGDFQTQSSSTKGICLILSLSKDKELLMKILKTRILDIATEIAMSDDHSILQLMLKAILNLKHLGLLENDWYKNYPDFWDFLKEKSEDENVSKEISLFLQENEKY